MTATAIQTKKATPLSTAALAAFLTWKQFDILRLLADSGPGTTRAIAANLEEIVKYDQGHGGAFYSGSNPQATGSSMRTLEKRQLVYRTARRNGPINWSITARAKRALDWIEAN